MITADPHLKALAKFPLEVPASNALTSHNEHPQCRRQTNIRQIHNLDAGVLGTGDFTSIRTLRPFKPQESSLFHRAVDIMERSNRAVYWRPLFV